MSIRQNGQIIAGIQSTKCYNIGDIFYTSRTDTTLNGAVECNGASYNTTDFTDAENIGTLLQANKLPYVSITQFDSDVASKGSCRCFGWDGGTIFKVPKLADVYIECGTASTPDEFGEESLPNITGEFHVIGNNAAPQLITADFSGAFTNANKPSGTYTYTNAANASSTHTPVFAKLDASRSSSTYQDGAHVHPKHIKYRAMIQLFNSATDEAVATCGSVLADISEIKSNKADKLYQDYKSCTNGSIVLEDGKSIYWHNPTETATTFVFDDSNLTKNTDFVTFELGLFMNPAVSLTFPSSVIWISNETPDISQAGTYFFTFRKMPDGFGNTYWYGCLEGRW